MSNTNTMSALEFINTIKEICSVYHPFDCMRCPFGGKCYPAIMSLQSIKICEEWKAKRKKEVEWVKIARIFLKGIGDSQDILFKEIEVGAHPYDSDEEWLESVLKDFSKSDNSDRYYAEFRTVCKFKE